MLICYHDVTSPAAAVAVLRLQRLADTGVAVAFQGLDPLGLDVAIPPTLDQLEELEAYRDRAAALGLTLRRPSRRPPTLLCHLVADLAEHAGLGAAWRLATLRAYWEDDADLGDADVLVALSRQVGLHAGSVAAALADRQARLGHRRLALEARSRGIGGVPVLEYQGTLVPADLPDEAIAQLAAM